MTEPTKGLSYRDAGVDIDAADEALRRSKEHIKRTFNDNVLRDIGSFGAMYELPTGYEQPVLVSSVDGVGTKLKIAFLTKKHDTIGQDLVSHCVNDILVQGARPLFFLDYIACGKLDPFVVSEVIKGLATGCRYSGCALIGGETAEMPGMYADDEYDLAGTIVGIVDRADIVDGSTIAEGDVVIGLPSSGLHTNGYSLARRICFEAAKLSVDDEMPGVGRTIGDALLEPHVSYAKQVAVYQRVATVKGMAHITGGGLTDNLPRVLPDGLGITIELGTWPVLPIFRFLQEAGGVERNEMLRTFNMGIGYCLIADEAGARKILDTADTAGETAYRIGTVTKGDGTVKYSGELNYG